MYVRVCVLSYHFEWHLKKKENHLYILFELAFYEPVKAIWVMSGRSVYLTTLLLNRLSPQSSLPILVHIVTTPFLDERKRENDVYLT